MRKKKEFRLHAEWFCTIVENREKRLILNTKKKNGKYECGARE